MLIGVITNLTSAPSSTTRKLLELLDPKDGLQQMIREPTRWQTNVDVVLTNNETTIQNLTVVPGITDHDMVIFDINLKLEKEKKLTKPKIFCIRKKANIDKMEDDVMSFWDFYRDFKSHRNISRPLLEWTGKSLKSTIMERSIPIKTSSSRFNLSWFNRAHRRLCKKTQRPYKAAKRSDI